MERAPRLFPCAALGLMLLAGIGRAQVQAYPLGSIPMPNNGRGYAAHDGKLAICTDGTVDVYQVDIVGAVEPTWQIVTQGARFVEFHGPHLLVLSGDDQGNWNLSSWDTGTQSQLASVAVDCWEPQWTLMRDNLLVLNSLSYELIFYDIGPDGGIELVAQHEASGLFQTVYPALNGDYIAALWIFQGLVLYDISDLQAPFQVDAGPFFEDEYQVGFLDHAMIVGGIDHSPYYSGFRVLGYGNGGFQELSSIPMVPTYGPMLHSRELVVAKGNGWPPTVDLVNLFHVTDAMELSYLFSLQSANVESIVLDETLLYFRDTEEEQLVIHGLFRSPRLHCRVLPGNRLGLEWRAVPGALGYRLYAIDGAENTRTLLADLAQPGFEVDLEPGMRRFEVVAWQ
jgi:hypothetical protein